MHLVYGWLLVWYGKLAVELLHIYWIILAYIRLCSTPHSPLLHLSLFHFSMKCKALKKLLLHTFALGGYIVILERKRYFIRFRCPFFSFCSVLHSSSSRKNQITPDTARVTLPQERGASVANYHIDTTQQHNTLTYKTRISCTKKIPSLARLL